ncbi:glycoside hydrolase family 13 protein [Punctularia strigosozonata HHB-11173 SS5]|uniref:glycoside hydrolase family 13 protein n=1 Tax=Punctularia strigosozonata (strain HHB-11173) TaxID=741275 RepID=UPI0004417FE8|nr:glycoside hydrolase family 13 protein [Punctularia strigosozonata HHB-11173 SS5]EIN06497.1 glycoside hydrolase family 13 protein [Punctularia strigosozonata HHB-11173 SS5]
MPDPVGTPPSPRQWQKSAVVYQIYPVSFFDSNGDGLGDLKGIEGKLDYLKELGADVLWLSPIYPSPLADMGYDISDYKNIDPRYGTLQDWDRLVEGVHARDMKLVMDLVVNHTSDEHAWFKESRSSKINPKRDWYIWRPPKYDKDGNRMEPNNWRSVFQGSAWQWDENTEEYYLHLYVPGQPDLNWENPEVRNAVWSVLRFWLDRGCDGFRMDVINLISKVPGLPDAPITDLEGKYQVASMFYANGPRVHEFLQEMRQKVLSSYDTFTVGEAPFSYSADDLAAYVLPPNRELNMVFQFEHMGLDEVSGQDPLVPAKWTLADLKRVTEKWQTFKRDEGYWNSIYIQNHDQARAVSRFGNDSPKWRAVSAKLLCMFNASLSGTLFVYQGEEIGMKNFPRSWGIEEYKDVASQNYYQKRKKAGPGVEIDMSDVVDGLQKKARDHARTPVQWDSSPNAGFTTGTPWMRTNDDEGERAWTIAAQLQDPDSVLSFYRQALKVRKEHDVLIYGDFKQFAPEHPQIFAYTRSLGDAVKALILLNFGENEADIAIPQDVENRFLGNSRLVLTNYASEEEAKVDSSVTLKGYEGRIYVTYT